MKIPKIKTKLEVLNLVDGDEAELYLYGYISSYSWWGDDEDVITSKKVRDALRDIKATRLNIHINSGGGDVFESIAIHNLLKSFKGEKVIFIDGLAASGASVIAMAGDKIIMPKNAMMMIHKAWTYAAGNADELMKIANDLSKMDTAVLESYTDKFVGEREELEKLLADETWLTAEECLALGFCSEVGEEIKLPEEEEEKETVKDSIVAKYAASVKAQAEETEQKKPDIKNVIINAFKHL